MKRRFARTFAVALAALGLAGCATALTEAAAPALDDRAMQTFEHEIGGRIGVALIEEGGETIYAWRGDERFAMCSTFKLPLAGAILALAERGELSTGEAIAFDESDLLSYAPVTSEQIDRGEMTVAELSDAIVTLSDNTAANLLLERIGGPAALTRFFREIGDNITRLDRTEPTLNRNERGDPRDTTSPVAMAETVRQLIFAETLNAASRERLATWAVASTTGDDRIRAGLPDGWRVGDKSGTCGYGEAGAVNDVAIIWPPEGEAFVLAVYIDRPAADAEDVNAVIAEIARLSARHRP